MMAIKTPNPTDKYVGARIRMRRLMLGMSQTALADGLDLTFQQIQKYEKGVNRVGASRVQQIAHILRVPVEFFFEGGPAIPGTKAGAADAPSLAHVSEFLATPDGLALVGAGFDMLDVGAVAAQLEEKNALAAVSIRVARHRVGGEQAQCFGRNPRVAVIEDFARDLLDGFAGQLLRLDLNGNVLAAVGKSGKGVGEFGEAHYVAVSPKGEIYVADTVNSAVQKFVKK